MANMKAVTSLLWKAFLLLILVPTHDGAKQNSKGLIMEIDDLKELKKLVRTKTNLLIIFAKSEKAISNSMSLFNDVATEMKGKATLALVDCSESKKLCKNQKASPSPMELKHFKDGSFNKEYDRKMVKKSMVNFLLDPTGDIPWEEEPDAGDVVHPDTPQSFNKLLKKEKGPMLVMFYAPWCGFCKRLKPDFSAAATEMKGKAVLVGVDVDKPQQMQLRMDYNITGFPTIYYFEKGKKLYLYGGENNKEGIISWLKNPGPPSEKPKEAEWADEPSEVVHLTDSNFQEYIKTHPSVLVMFYAPWCGHCKQMKPDYAKAAETLKEENIEGILAAVDATKEKTVGDQFSIKGFPTVKYFKDGEFAFDVNERTEEKIVEFMKDPKEPPPPPPPEPKWDETESEVSHLTDENFKSTLKKKKHGLVMFYAPWCGHCKKAKPEFTQAAAKLKDDSKVLFAAIDCTVHSTSCTAHEVTGYPTFKYFKYGKSPQNYMGGREEADFVNFMSDPQNPGASPPAPAVETPAQQWAEVVGMENLRFLTTDSFDSFLQEHNSVLVMFYAPWCGHCKAMKPAYGEAATILNDQEVNGVLAAVDATLEPNLASRFGVKGYPTLKYFKDGQEAFEYNKGRTTNDLVSFMKNPSSKEPTPPAKEESWSDVPSGVKHLTDDNFASEMAKMDSALVMFYAPWCGHCKKAKPAFQAAADKLEKMEKSRGFVAVDCTVAHDTCEKGKIEGFPTFKLYVKGDFLIEYNGERTEDEFLKYILNAPTANNKDEL
ncbi:protein disulfide-isomerase A5-like [Ylistrum balloti]|uniref:protein disulfide-isomerase A5-like n=1 Tax=Ylistrum balloti TaxID=509963 RepID=UPI002905922B|nr:protein disulfide-isomerase A5-like [Ylistrum balloti]